MPKQKTKILFISFLFLVAMTAGAFFGLYFNVTNKISTTIQEIDQIKSEITDHESRDYMKKDIELARNYKNTLDGYLVQKEGVVSFLKTLEILVASSSLKSQVNSVSYESTTKLSSVGLELVHINMSVNGEWKNIQLFLNLLEFYPLQISIKNINLNKFAEYMVKGNKIPQWSGSFDFVVVKIKDK